MADEFDKALSEKPKEDEFDKEWKKHVAPSDVGNNPGAFFKYAAPVVPHLLSIAGGFAGGPAGAGLGSVAGTELQNEFPDTFGKPPDSLMELLGRTGMDVALGGGVSSAVKAGKALPSIVKGAAKEGFNSAITPVVDLPRNASWAGKAMAIPAEWPVYGHMIGGETGRAIGGLAASVPILKGIMRGGRQGLQDYRVSQMPETPWSDNSTFLDSAEKPQTFQADDPRLRVPSQSETPGATGLGNEPSLPMPKQLAAKIKEYNLSQNDPRLRVQIPTESTGGTGLGGDVKLPPVKLNQAAIQRLVRRLRGDD